MVKLRPLRNRARFSGATFIRAVQMLYLPHSCQQTGLWNVELPVPSEKAPCSMEKHEMASVGVVNPALNLPSFVRVNYDANVIFGRGK